MDVSLLTSPPASLPCNGIAPVTPPEPKREDRSTFTVILAPLPSLHNWLPNCPRTPIPSDVGNLPRPVAVELVDFLNAKYQQIGRCRIAVAYRILNGATRYGVLTVDADTQSINNNRNKLKLPNRQAKGLTPMEAEAEVQRLNKLIMAYSRIPKVWAIAVLEGFKAPKVKPVTSGEAVSA